MASPDPLLSRKEIAAHFGRRRETVWRWEQEGLRLIGGRGTIGDVVFFLEQRDAARELSLSVPDFFTLPRSVRALLLELAMLRRIRVAANATSCNIADSDTPHGSS